MSKRRSILTSEQRALYAAALSAGVPENVIVEWDGTLKRYVQNYAAAMIAAQKRRRDRVL